MFLVSDCFADYALLDSGDGEKLERYGAYVLRRPEPKALWARTMQEEEWRRRADAVFSYNKGAASNVDERGTWSAKPNMPDRWQICYTYDSLRLTLRLGLTAFKHVGIFPEQSPNWNYIFDACKSMHTPQVLNLFAYTGAATLAARAAGAEVVHLDAVKQVVTWANENSRLSKLEGIKWIVDDAVKYVERQVRRGIRYDGIILDPPAYGRGPAGERWLLNEGILLLLQSVRKIAAPSAFVVLNIYSLGISAAAADTLMRTIFGTANQTIQSGELGAADMYGKRLPLSVFVRCRL